MSNNYLVKWEINIEADTPREAAQQAWEHMRREDNITIDLNDNPYPEHSTIEAEGLADDEIAEMQNYDNSTYSPECFDGRFFKWDGYVLDSMPECEDDNIMVLTIDGKFLGDFHMDPQRYEDDQEKYLNDALETVKNWIIEQDLPPLLQEQQE